MTNVCSGRKWPVNVLFDIKLMEKIDKKSLKSRLKMTIKGLKLLVSKKGLKAIATCELTSTCVLIQNWLLFLLLYQQRFFQLESHHQFISLENQGVSQLPWQVAPSS